MAACRGGCAGSGPRLDKPQGALALFPAETRIVLSIDFRKIRATPLWKQLAALAGDDPQDRRIIDELTARTGLDPFTHVHRLVAAFPDEARKDGAFAVLFEGEGFDEKRLLTYVRDQAKLRGQNVEQRPRGKRVVLSSTGESPLSGVFLDRGRFVLGGGGWAERVVDLVDGAAAPDPSAANNPILARLADRVGAGRALWAAAIVPEPTRAALMADPRFGAQASVMRLGAGADLGPGLSGELVAELSNPDDAQVLVGRMNEFLMAAKRSPKALLLGAGPYLDGVAVAADGPQARVKVNIDQAQTAELIRRLQALVRPGAAP